MGAKGPCPQDAKIAFLPIACAVHFCSETNEIYTQCMHF